MTRTRLCNNPVPANGGAACMWSKRESESCSSNKNGPVHGGWSQWLSWDSCSVTCDIGMQHRDRSCSQPYPAYGGNMCFGDGRDDRLCLPGACADGHWSAWGPWGSCSKSCDGGLRKRSRHCNKPAPSIMGQACIGDSFEAELCSKSPCQGAVVFFAKDLTNYTPGPDTALIFPNVRTNVGNAYNNVTGMFTEPRNGTYDFSVQLCVMDKKEVIVGLYINDNEYQRLLMWGDIDNSCRTFSVTAILKQGDKVHVKTDSVTQFGHLMSSRSYYFNTVSGALVMRL